MVRGLAGIILVSHFSTVVRQTYLDTPAWVQERDVCILLLTKSILGLPGCVLGTEVSETFVLHACSHWSNPIVSWTLGFVGAAKLGIRA